MTQTGGTNKRKIVHRRIAELVPYARNSRTHSDEQVAQIAASIREFGWTNPLLIDEAGGIVAGHGRLLAAQSLGAKDVPCIVLEGLSEAQKRALIIADNKLALNAGWDEDLLSSELQSLLGEGFDLAMLGFDDGELAALLADKTDGLTDPDDVPEVPSDAVTVLGDVWLLGKHRIVCGDSTDAGAVAKCLNGVVPHLMVTDPPYGVEYDPSWRVGLHRTKRDGSALDKPAYAAVGDVSNDGQADWRDAWALFPGDVAYVWCASLHVHEVAASLLETGFRLRSLIIWAKPHFSIGRGDYHWQHEPCWYAVRTGRNGHWQGDRKQATIWQITSGVGFTTQKDGKDGRTGHSTQKPVECMKRPIENNSSPGQAVYEPFSGSGTTIIAGEMTGRSIHAIELSPAYVDVAVLRWQEFAGHEATLEATGETFAAVSEQRAKVAEAA